MQKLYLYALLFVGAAGTIAAQTSSTAITLPTNVVTGKKIGGSIYVPTSQLLQPSGRNKMIAGRPVELAIDSARRKIAVLNSEEIEILDSQTDQVLTTIKARTTSYGGIAFRPGDAELWASESQRNIGDDKSGADGLLIASMDKNGKASAVNRIEFAGHAVPIGIAFSNNGSRAWVALDRNNTVAVIDANNRKVLQEIPVGMAPFGVAVAERAGLVFVANRGGRRPKAGETTAPSSGSQILTDPVSGSSASGTVSVISTSDFSVREIPVGLAPSNLAVSPDGSTVAVANAHGDSITFIDVASLTAHELKVPTWPESAIGSQPISVTFSPDGGRIYVPCAGNNAIAVLVKENNKWEVAGALPTAWFPTSVALDAEGALHISNIKGIGNTAVGDGSYKSTHWVGSVETIPAPSLQTIADGTRQVRALNQPKLAPSGGIANLESLGIEHVIFIIKENRTYDQIFGDMAKGNSEPRFLQYGRDITPNAHALADKYVLLDNFYTSGAISFDGHQWLMMSFVSDYTERSFASYPRGYAWEMGDALTVAPTGFFWQGRPKALSVRIYGEFCVAPDVDPTKENMVDMNVHQGPDTWTENLNLYEEGKLPRRRSCQSGVPALNPYVDQYYTHSMTVPDQAKADEFIHELNGFEKSGKMPNLIIMTLNNDHTNGTRPGAPTPRAYVADNDLALGRVVERVSKSPFWEKTLILVTEDDAQDGLDHVDGHRTVGLVIGPHVKRGVVDSTNYSHLSMIRTIQEIFAIPPRTRFAKAARPMSSVFTAQADLTPFEHLTPKVSLHEMNPPLSALTGKARWAAQQSLAMDFTDVDRNSPDLLNRILWWDSRGYDTPYPSR